MAVAHVSCGVCVSPGTFQLLGTVFYMGVEISEGFVHLVGVVSGHQCHKLGSLVLTHI